MAENLYLFADNNEGVAENLGSYRLYDMKIEGEPEGVSSGVNYVDYIYYDKGGTVFKTGIIYKPNTRVVIKINEEKTKYDGLNSIFCVFNESIYNQVYQNNKLAITTIKNNNVLEISKRATLAPIDGVYDYTFTETPNETYSICVGCSTSSWDGARAIENFKIYQDDVLVLNLNPCLDENGICCLYDEVSKKYLYHDNSLIDEVKYKKILRDYQPVLDSNNIPCLLDKKNMKYYYNKGTGVFGTKEKVNYRKLKYIQGDGDSYIDTGLIGENIIGYDVEIKCLNIETTGKGYLFGIVDKNNNVAVSNIGCYGNVGANSLYMRGFEDYTKVRDDKIATIKLTNLQENTCKSSMFLFAGSDSHDATLNEPYFFSNVAILYFKVFDTDDNLVMHLIPAMSTNNEIGMYDLVSEQFFYNQGEGTFGYETEEAEVPEVNTEIEYIESTGTQYIDTEVVPTTNTDIDMTCRACDYNESPTINNSYILNELAINSNTYQYNDTDTTVQPNLLNTEAATLTMGTSNLNKLDEEDIEVATNNGWSLV